MVLRDLFWIQAYHEAIVYNICEASNLLVINIIFATMAYDTNTCQGTKSNCMYAALGLLLPFCNIAVLDHLKVISVRTSCYCTITAHVREYFVNR